MSPSRFLPAFVLLLSIAWNISPAEAAEPAKVDVDRYQEVDLATLRATPEKFKNKRVRATTYYKGFLITFADYMEKSGFKSDKHYWLRIIPSNLPVMTKKTDAMNELIPSLDKGKVITVYGKINDFRYESKRIRAPEYFLDLEYLEVVADPVKIELTPEMEQEEMDQNAGIPGDEPPSSRISPRRLPVRRR